MGAVPTKEVSGYWCGVLYGVHLWGCVQARGWYVLTAKGQRVNNFGFVGQRVSMETPQLCHFMGKAAIDNKNMNGHEHVPIKLYLQNKWRASDIALRLLFADSWSRSMEFAGAHMGVLIHSFPKSFYPISYCSLASVMLGHLVQTPSLNPRPDRTSLTPSQEPRNLDRVLMGSKPKGASFPFCGLQHSEGPLCRHLVSESVLSSLWR